MTYIGINIIFFFIRLLFSFQGLIGQNCQYVNALCAHERAHNIFTQTHRHFTFHMLRVEINILKRLVPNADSESILRSKLSDAIG